MEKHDLGHRTKIGKGMPASILAWLANRLLTPHQTYLGGEMNTERREDGKIRIMWKVRENNDKR